VHGRRELVTTGQPEHWLALRQACAAMGLDTAGARLIHHYSNAIYLLPEHDAVARITYGHDAAERITRSQAITRWLGQQHQFPATQPLDNTSPVTVSGAVVSFWAYYPQPQNAPPLTSQRLAALLRLLHDAGTPPLELPAWVPLASLHATINDPVRSAALSGDERTWVMARIAEVRDKIAGLEWPLGIGLIHGDAWAGNLLSSPGAPPAGAVLGDWDWVSAGPREIDLIPTWHAAARYGKPASWVSDFTSRYGYDLGRWEGCPVLLAMRDLVQLSGPIRRARDSEPHRQALGQRLDSLRGGDTTSVWTAL
jgi:aminoglycoside phosphotransferase (APT) family kinase protein